MHLVWLRTGIALLLAFVGLCVAIVGLDAAGLAIAAVAAAGYALSLSLRG